MAISITDLKKRKAEGAPRVFIYGPPGFGKTTLASEFPEAAFLQVEDGTPGDLELNSFGHLQTFDEVMQAVSSLYTEDHGYQTVVVDGIDKLEPLVWAKTCERNNWESIESPGYGKGYLAADTEWKDFLEGLNALRRERGMAVVLIGHSAVERFDDPRTQSYSRFDLRLHKRAHAIIEDEMDAILFVNQDASIKLEDQGFNKKRAHADGSQIWIYAQGRPALNAKNRYGMPPKMIFKKGEGFKALAPYLARTTPPAEAEAGASNEGGDKAAA